MKKGHKPTKKTIKACDEGRKGMQDVLVETARVLKGKRLTLLVWFLTRFFRRRITDEYIEYEFYLLKDEKKELKNA
jgi:hypothetical protein